MRDLIHELNNALHLINEYAENIKDKYESHGEGFRYANKIQEAVSRVDTIVSMLESDYGENGDIGASIAEESSLRKNNQKGVSSAIESHNNERVLLVDDEDIALSIAFKRLTALNFTVTACKSSDEAIRAIKNNDVKYHIGLVDQRMPLMSGIELAKELTKLQPGLPIVLCTGYKVEMTDEEKQETGIVDIVRKPFLIHKIAETIRQILDSK